MLLTKIKSLIPAPETTPVYYLTSSVNVLQASHDGIVQWDDPHDEYITITQWKRVGNEEPQKCSDYSIIGAGQWVETETMSFPYTEGNNQTEIVILLVGENFQRIASLTIPVLWAGEPGVTYEIIPEVDRIHVTSSGTSVQGDVNIRAYKISPSGREALEIGKNPGSYSLTTAVAGVSYILGKPSGSEDTTLACLTKAIIEKASKLINLKLLKGGSVISEKNVDIVIDADSNKTFYYFAGKFDDETEYTSTAHEAPYVSYTYEESVTIGGVATTIEKTQYYMLVAETNRLTSGSSSILVAPQDQEADGIWELMTSDFKYIIAQAFFADFAKLGSAIFCGDWMISQWGRYASDGELSEDYRKFDPSNPLGGAWIPNVFIDFSKGEVYALGGKIRITQSAAYFDNVVVSGLMKRKKTLITKNNWQKYIMRRGTVAIQTEDGHFIYDIDKIGSWVEIDSSMKDVGDANFPVLVLPSFDAVGYNNGCLGMTKDDVRAFIGAEIMISDKSNVGLKMILFVGGEPNIAQAVTNAVFTAKCVLSGDGGSGMQVEKIDWEITSAKQISND